MESLFTERKALHDHIKWIREEIKTLNNDYWRSIERLRELDGKLESSIGASEVVEKLIEVIARQNETVHELKSLIPNVPLEIVIEKFQQTTETTTVTQSKFSSSEIEQEKVREESQAPIKRRKKLDLQSLSVEVAGFLKSKSEMEVSLKEIVSYLESKSIKLSNPSNTISKMMGHNERIERAGYGLYHYKK